MAVIGNEEAEEPNKFEVRVAAGETCYKILKPVKDGEGTGIQMSYSFQFE